jgi:hydroxyquinol 1,2-dioxygenase
MRNLDENTITDEVIARLAQCPDPRLKIIMTSLVRHLHAFARDVQLTEEEWFEGIQFLTATGDITDAKRQEFVLLSDTLGLSMLVIAQNNRKPAGATEATVFGPYRVANPPPLPCGSDISNGAVGQPCYVEARIRGLHGESVGNAVVEVWQADADGFYDVQYAGNDEPRARAVMRARPDGTLSFKTVLPEAYPIPADGPVGRMLEATGRHVWRPAHIHFMIDAPGYEPLVTHLFRDSDRYLESDVVFGVRSSLVTHWQRHPPGLAPDGTSSPVEFYVLSFDFVLNDKPSPLPVTPP